MARLRPEERYYIDIELKKGTSQNKMEIFI
jgi:hypothetical protein